MKEFGVIVKYPDKFLRKRSADVPVEECGDFSEIIEKMKHIMYSKDGVGLAAPQVGLSARVITVDPSPAEEPYGFMYFINPEIIARSKNEDIMEEGCLSLPGIIAPVVRAVDVKIRYNTLDGEVKEAVFSDFTARVLQHEIDHLNGILFIDRVTPAELLKIKPELKELENEYKSSK